MANSPDAAGRHSLSCYADCQTIHHENKSFPCDTFFAFEHLTLPKKVKRRSNFWVDLWPRLVFDNFSGNASMKGRPSDIIISELRYRQLSWQLVTRDRVANAALCRLRIATKCRVAEVDLSPVEPGFLYTSLTASGQGWCSQKRMIAPSQKVSTLVGPTHSTEKKAMFAKKICNKKT